MRRATLRSLLAHKLRLALSAVAIVLGVAFVAGTMIFTDTLDRTFTDLFESTASDVAVTPEGGAEGIDGPAGTLSVPGTLVGQVRAVDGVAAAEGYVQAQGVYLLTPAGEVLDTGGAPGIGISWTSAPGLDTGELTAGRAPERAGEVALDSGSAEEAGYAVGDRVTLLTPGPRVEATVVGVFTFGEDGGLAGASLTAFDVATAQQLTGVGDGFSGIQVAAAEDVSHDELADRVVAAVGDGYTVQTAQQQADEQSAALEEGLSFITVLLTAFAVIALFVGSFIILNTFSMLVAQRTRELALLRALGAGRGQVTRSVLLEAVVLGVVGATVGLAGGFGIATGLRALFGTFGLTLDGDLVLSADTVVWSYAVGVLVTVLAAWVPARRAARTPPVAAMRDDHVAVERSLRRRTAFGVALVAVAAGALAGSVAAGDSGHAPALVGVGGLALVLGAVALSPVLARPVVRVLGAPLPRLAGTAGRLARDNAQRNPRRTAATASALMVGLTLVTGFGVLGASANASVDALVDDTVRADYVVSTAVGQPFTPEVADRLRQLPEVDAVLQQRFTQVRVDGQSTFAAAVDATTLDRGLALEYVAGGSDGLAGRGLLVDETTAAERGWEVGDTVAAESAGGQPTELTVGGVYAANQAVGSMVLSLDTDAALGGPALDRYVYVVLADGTDAAAARAALETVVDAYPVVGLKDRDEFAGEQKAQVDQVLLLINALLVLSVLIAVLGIVNTLAMSVLERTREIGLLRAVGMDRRQLRRTVRLEAVLISVYGAVLGLGLGLVLGVGLTRALADQGITELVVPGGQLAGFLVLGALIGVVAAVWPARRAARLQVLDAIATA
ncbi:putative ABC transport system permease protein [Geodermatophilus saharensis]|uniref:Putative ABC transport system permease protein n=1 Tax=Geodermatophilus saharensis TaxID=1137994 RepID=A0A239E671_9ACTN|nr:FtsX-like permease family protein [Geodermatophilus saharensis]SNS39941.1 putative ABC transport system permease protein [Geodermatophilus saharensis]